MVSCRYVGNESSQIGDREFDAIGQKASFSEALFTDVVRGGAAFILESDFQRCGFTAEELAKFGPSGLRIDPTQVFEEKVTLAQNIFRDIQQSMLCEA